MRSRSMSSALLSMAAMMMALAAQAQSTTDAPADAYQLPRSAVWEMPSDTGETYRILIAEPLQPAPPEGWPVIYLTDGNSAFGIVTDVLRMQSRHPDRTGLSPALVVAIGYPTEQPLDDRRYHDLAVYAPASSFPQRPGAPPPRDSGGGADAFLDFIVDELKPAVERHYPVDRARQALMGHSLGGLFTLHVLFHRPEAFQRYIALSPSVWWNDRYILDAADRFAAARAAGDPPVNLFVSTGSLEQIPGSGDIPMVDLARDVVARLQPLADRGVRAEFFLGDGENHGSILPAVASRALRQVQAADADGPGAR